MSTAERRFTIRWTRPSNGGVGEYKVSIPNYDGGEVVEAEDYDRLRAITEELANWLEGWHGTFDSPEQHEATDLLQRARAIPQRGAPVSATGTERSRLVRRAMTPVSLIEHWGQAMCPEHNAKLTMSNQGGWMCSSAVCHIVREPVWIDVVPAEDPREQ